MDNVLDYYHQKAVWWAKILSWIPTLEAVFLSGSLATGKAHKDSDIDFFILVRPGTIWFTRFWVFLILKICGQLAKPHNHRGRICPNHFITTEFLVLREQNAYTAEMFAQNRPLYDPRGWFYCFAQENQSWTSRFGYDFAGEYLVASSITKRALGRSLMGTLGLISEPFWAFPQRWKIQRSWNQDDPEGVLVLEARELRFHPRAKSRL